MFGKTRALDPLATHPTILGLLDAVLGEYQLSAPTAIDIGPGEGLQPLHPDDAIYPIPRPHPELVVNIMWPLHEFTEANGATRIVVGSHTWVDELPTPDTPTVAVEMPAGSALVYLGSVWHGGGANTTDRSRLGVVMHYAACVVAAGREPRSGRAARGRGYVARAAAGAAWLQHLFAVHRLRRRPPPEEAARRDARTRVVGYQYQVSPSALRFAPLPSLAGHIPDLP